MFIPKVKNCSLLIFVTVLIMNCSPKEVPHPVPTADFLFSIGTNGNVNFVNNSVNSETYIWDFGDNSPKVSDFSPTHKYDKNGNYYVKLEVTGKGGKREIIKIITIQIPAPISNFTLTSFDFLAPASINLTNLSKNANQYEWYLNDIKKAESFNASFTLSSGQHVFELKSTGFGTSIKRDTVFIFEPSIYDLYGNLRIVKNNIFVSKVALKNPKFHEVILYVNNRLQDMESKLPLKFLQFSHNIKMWFENDERIPFLSAHYMPKDYAVANNVFAPKQNSVIIPHLTISLYETGLFNQPEILIHEMAHAYHDMILGFNFRPIIDAYDNAMSSGKYQNVKRTKFPDGKAYATTNHKEYFAELNEAYFGTNDHYPFNKADLKLYDPVGYKLLESIWK